MSDVLLTINRKEPRIGTAIVGAIGFGVLCVAGGFWGAALSAAASVESDSAFDAGSLIGTGLGGLSLLLLGGTLLAVGRKDLRAFVSIRPRDQAGPRMFRVVVRLVLVIPLLAVIGSAWRW